MGVFLNLSIVPERIPAERWASVYQETLTLLDRFPFLDRVKSENGYFYAARSVHRENVLNDWAGWETEGDMHNGPTMESFFLVDDIAYYRKKTCNKEDNGQDVLFDCLYEEIEAERPPCAWVWGAKTQGCPAHLGLLAIACLICHRFPNAAIVHGDITAAQCRRAVDWANQFLEEPIDIPVTADAKRLIPRLLDSKLEEKDILPAFERLTLEPHNDEVGKCIQKLLPAHSIENHYKKKFLPYERRPDKLYLNRSEVKEYLELGLDFRALCRMVMIDQDGNQLTPREFMKALLEMKVHIPLDEKVLYDYVASPKSQGSAEAETVHSQLVSALFAMYGGGNRNVAAYIPLEEIVKVFDEMMGAEDGAALAETLLEEIGESTMSKNQNAIYDGEDGFYKKALKQSEEEDAKKASDAEKYDIAGRGDVIDYCKGDTVEPELHAALINYANQLKKIGTKAYEERVKDLDEDKRKTFFHRNYRTLIPKEIEDSFFARIMDKDFIIRYVSLYSVEVTEGIRWVIRGFLWNPELLDHYWELAAAETE